MNSAIMSIVSLQRKQTKQNGNSVVSVQRRHVGPGPVPCSCSRTVRLTSGSFVVQAAPSELAADLRDASALRLRCEAWCAS